MWIFYLFAIILTLQGIASLRGGFRFRKYVREQLSKPVTGYAPFVTIVAPCRGLDQGLEENLTALFNQDYPTYEVILVTDRKDDPSTQLIYPVRILCQGRKNVTSTVVIAGEANECGQKVHNLRAAVSEASLLSEVFVFADSDARPNATWLRSLVAPLFDERVGAATGYRWFIPTHGGFSSNLRAVWNASIASALGPRGEKNFCWGGATAIRRATFEKLDMLKRWRGTLSDDFALTRALHQAGMPICFVPACLTASFEDCNFREMLEFTTRQLKITRVYASHLWKAVFIGSALFVSVFFGGIALVIVRALLGLPYGVPLILLGVIFILGAWKSFLRLQSVKHALNHRDQRPHESTIAHLTLWPFASMLYLYNAVSALFSRRIEWRGITYELKSPTETVIMTRK